MSKSIIYAVNSNTQTTNATGSIVSFGSIVRRYGCNLDLSNGNVIIKGAGYYDLDTNFSITPSSTGTLTIQLFKDGTPISGAKAVIATTGDAIAVSIPAIVRSTCECESTITAVFTGVATTVTNAAIDVIKL